MRQLVLVGPGAMEWAEVGDPGLTSAAAAVVRPLAVATCDLDIGVLAGRFPLPGPYPFGHEAVAEVIAVGDDVRRVAPGDVVVVPFQISCGACEPCRRGHTGNCASHPRMSTYGLGSMGGLEWGGLFADLAAVPHADAMLVPLPDGIDPVVVASASDNLPDAWRAVGPQLAAFPGADVLIVAGDAGPNSIGLYAAGLAVALGGGRVAYLDHDESRLEVARALGADVIEARPSGKKVGSFPVTVDASGTQDGIQSALNSTAFDGTCTSVSVFLEDPVLPLFAMYSRCCTFHTGRAHARPAIPAVLELVARGFDPSPVTSVVVDWDDAPAALAALPRKLIARRPASHD